MRESLSGWRMRSGRCKTWAAPPALGRVCGGGLERCAFSVARAAVFGGHGFGGRAEETLAYIQNTLIPECFTAHHLAEQTKIMLCGYSLAGLFALWAGSQSERFSAVAGVSPSVWFPGFGDYEQAHPIRAEHVYLSLGDREEQTKNRAMAAVGNEIRALYARLQTRKTDCALEWNAGNHFREPERRVAKGVKWMLDSL